MNNERTHETAFIERTRFEQLRDAGYPVEDRADVPTVIVPPVVYQEQQRERTRVLQQAKAARKRARKQAAASRQRNRRG